MQGIHQFNRLSYSNRSWLGPVIVLFVCVMGCQNNSGTEGTNQLKPEKDGCYHVREGEDIQLAIEAAAADPKHKTIKVHEGTYAPKAPGQAFIYLNQKHDGVKLKAIGKVVLTAANPKLAIVSSRSFPAIVNHIVYFGHGISNETVIDGFEISGANGHMTQEGIEVIEPDLPDELSPTLFFFSDGGAVKIYGDSCPKLLNLRIIDNEVRICGAGVSVDQRGLCKTPVLIQNCVFKDNRCPATGSAIDVLQDSKATIKNCLFVGNIGNYGMEEIAETFRLSYNSEHGCGALTVFPKSTVNLEKCTFTENWSGVDDKGVGSTYRDSIFWKNDKSDGTRSGDPYELDVNDSAKVTGCMIFGGIADLNKTIDVKQNNFENLDPAFDEDFVPQSANHKSVGFRPADVDETK